MKSMNYVLIDLCLKRIHLMKEEGRIAKQRREVERQITLYHVYKNNPPPDWSSPQYNPPPD